MAALLYTTRDQKFSSFLLFPIKRSVLLISESKTMQFSLSAMIVGLRLATALLTALAIPANAEVSSVTPVVPVQPIATYIPPTASSEASVTKIFSYNGGGFENLAFRSNGQLLATIAFPEGLLFYIDPLMIRPGIVLHNFTSLQNTLGITELAHDMFYIVGKGIGSGPFSVFSVDMRNFVILPDGTIFTPPVVKEIASVPAALGLNGMTYIRRSDKFVLISDSLLGCVGKFYVESGMSEVIIKDPSMAGLPNTTEVAAFGINGIRTQNDTLFYCNSGAQSFYRMPVSIWSYNREMLRLTLISHC